MTVNITKPATNLAEKLAEQNKPTGAAGEALLRADTAQQQQAMLGVGRRNLIINGGFKVNQRASSYTTTSAYVLDRWKFQTDLLDEYTHTVTQSTDAPNNLAYSLKITVTTSETAVATTEDLAITQFIEGQDCQSIGMGTVDAKPLTLSFWVKSSKRGQFACAVTAIDDNYIFPATYTIDHADTWEYKVISIPPSIIPVIDCDNTQGLSVRFITISGTSYTSGATGQWVAYASNYFAAQHETNISTSGDTWQLAGVQLEVGSVATPFEDRSYGEELTLCERYFYIRKADGSGDRLANGHSTSSTTFSGFCEFPTTMRASPTLGTSGTATDYTCLTGNDTIVTCSAVPTAAVDKWGGLIQGTVASGLTAGEGGQIRAANSNAYLSFDAEL